MTTLKKLIDTYQKIYSEWCTFGMPDGIVKRYQGQGGTGYKKLPKNSFDIHKCCETGEYVDRLSPWLCYDQTNGSLAIYCVYLKNFRRILSLPTWTSVLPKTELINYARQHTLKLDILQGRLTPEGRKNAEIVVLSGRHDDFIKAGWEKTYQAGLRNKEHEIERFHQGCTETAEHIKKQLSEIEKAFRSAAMEAMTLYECGHGNAAPFLSDQWYYTLCSNGVMWHNLSGATLYDPTRDSYLSYDGSWFMPFSKIGFEDLQTEDQLFCFAAAMFCRKNRIAPAELTAGNIIWNCEIISTNKGLFINNPRLKRKEEETNNLQPIF